MFIFIHLENTGGTTLWSLLRNNDDLNARRIRKVRLRASGASLDDAISGLPAATRCTGGHYDVRDFLGRVRNPVFFTMLKEPVARLEGDLNRRIRNGKAKTPATPAEFEKMVMKRAGLRTRKLLSRLTTHSRSDIMRLSNDASRYPDLVDEIFDQFAFVGVTDEFDHSMIQLGQVLDTDLKYPSDFRKNAAPEKQFLFTDRIRRQIQEPLLFEYLLHQRATDSLSSPAS